jgi:acyl-coenzyme A thioesterase PaaI-like protein
MSIVENAAYQRQPNSLHCFVCGLESAVGLRIHFTDNGREVRAEYTVNQVYQGYPGVVHGGIVAAMLDEAGGRAVMIGSPNRFMMTAKLEIRYRQPIPVETPLLLRGYVVRDRGRLAEVHSEIVLLNSKVAAEADLILATLPDDHAVEEDLQALGWRIYSA